jgi:hypothetical protein
MAKRKAINYEKMFAAVAAHSDNVNAKVAKRNAKRNAKLSKIVAAKSETQTPLDLSELQKRLRF